MSETRKNHVLLGMLAAFMLSDFARAGVDGRHILVLQASLTVQFLLPIGQRTRLSGKRSA